MAHGYMREYDEDYGRREDRDSNERGEDRNREWRGQDRDWRERDRDRDRGLMFRDEANRDWRRDTGWEDNGDWPQRSSRFARYGGELERERGRDRDQERRGYSSNPDDHYRSWRERQIAALDRDYADYCREREERFHSDFDAWRLQRHGNPEPLRTGMTQTGLSADPSGELELKTEAEGPLQKRSDPMATATLGNVSSKEGQG
jgi:hypothetical protein